MEGLSSISDILVYSFAVRRVGRAVLREDHIVHVEGVSPSHWRTRPCNRASGKAEGRDLACWGLTFLPPGHGRSFVRLLHKHCGGFATPLSPVDRMRASLQGGS